METKTMLGILMLLLVAVSVPAFADEGMDEEIDEEEVELEDVEEYEVDDSDEEEVEAFFHPLGAEVRLLQLKRSITRNILVGNEALEFLAENEPDADVEMLNEILDELEALLEQIDDLDMEKPANELAREFVDLKKQAISLTQEFREELREILPEGEISQLRQRARNVEEHEILDELKEQAHNRIRENNAIKVQEMLSNMGMSDEELVDRVRTGDVNAGFAVSELKNRLRSLHGQDVADAAQRIREEASRITVRKAVAMDEIIDRITERIHNASQKRIQKAEEIRSRLPEDADERASERIARIMEKHEEHTERFNEIANRIGQAIGGGR
ncbi:MAG TPA: hypothetical protein ENN46_04640 [Candidatus Woesearchaeota archaeon]|nr:hypothetical protein [Candidatus Woesearchaeota archaeon]